MRFSSRWLGIVVAAVVVALPAALYSESYKTVEGKFNLQGRQDGRGEYAGQITIAKVSGDRFSATGTVKFTDGAERRIDGVAYYNGFWWTKRLVLEYTLDAAGVVNRLGDIVSGASSDAVKIEGRYKVSSDKLKIYGPWKSVSGAACKGYDVFARAKDELKITAVDPAEGQQGDANKKLVILGENLPVEGQVQASDIAFLSGGSVDAKIKVTRIFDWSDDGSRIEIEASIAKDAAPGKRDVRVLAGLGRELFTVSATDVRLPLGRSAQVAGGAWAKLFVPDAEGGELTLTAAGATLEVHRGSHTGEILAAVSGNRFAIARAGHGWLYVKVNGTGNVSVANTFPQKAETPAAKKPWNFWYFPFFDRPGANQNLYDEGGAYEKFDLAVGIKADPNAKFDSSRHMDSKDFKMPTDAAELKKYNPSTTKGWGYSYQRSTDDKKSWWGHCWGAVVASSLWGQPSAKTVKDPAGKDVAFDEEEVEGLLTAFYTNHGCYPTNYMRDCPPGRPKDALKEPCDRFADDFFLGLQKGILRDGLPLAANLRAASTDEKQGDQVWNHVIWKYEARYQEVEGKDDPTCVEVALDVTATDDVFPSGPSAHRDESYVLRFKFGEDGQIKRDEADFQNWVSATHFCPSYLWRIKSATDDGTENEVLGKHWDDLARLFDFSAIR